MAWIGGNRYLTQTEQDNNAREVYNYLSSLSYSKNTIYALLGNMVQESTINPNLWESFQEGDTSVGYGLCQWTPMSKLQDYLANVGIDDWQNGVNQLYMLTTDSSQWGNSGNPNAPSVTPPITWNEFKVSNLSVETLTSYFMYYWERPSYDESINKLPYRIEKALYYKTLFESEEPTPTPKTKRKRMPLYMMVRKKKYKRRILWY